MKTFFDRVADIEAALGSANVSAPSDLQTTQLAAPTAPTVTQGGTPGSTNYSYLVADHGGGGSAAPSSATQTTTGAATLSATAFNIIAFPTIPGHLYRVYRSASSGTPSTTGRIAEVVATDVAASVNDTGLGVTSSIVPTANTTGALSPVGPIFGGAQIFPNALPAAENTVGAVTLTVAQLLSGLIIRGGTQTTGVTDTLPTAAAMVAALRGVKVGNAFDFVFRNTTNQTFTLGTATGITLATGNTNTIITVASHRFRCVFTNVTAGAEAVAVYSVDGSTAH